MTSDTVSELELRKRYSSMSREALIEELMLPRQRNHAVAFVESPSESSNSKKNKNKCSRAFDFSKHVQRRIALKISYLGWGFDGFASQLTTDNTIEEHLFKALIKAKLIESREECDYNRCGRTDKGVSAHCQVVAFNIRSKLPAHHPSAILHAGYSLPLDIGGDISGWRDEDEIPYPLTLNSILPPEIRVLAWAPVAREFSARFDAAYRSYKYFFAKADLDIGLMNESASMLVGRHDFRNFCKIDKTKGAVQAFERHIFTSHVEAHDRSGRLDSDPLCIYAFNIKGTAFLLNQVRCIMSVLFRVGRGLERPEVVARMLDIDTVPEKPCYELAPPLPLVLWECGYRQGPLDWVHSVKNHVNLMDSSMRIWESHQTKAHIAHVLTHDIMGNGHGCSNDPEFLEKIAESRLRSRNLVSSRYVSILEKPVTAGESIQDRLARYEVKRQKKFAQKSAAPQGS